MIRRRLIGLILLVLLATPAFGTIAFDACSEHTGTTTLSGTHTPSGTPAAVYVGITMDFSGDDPTVDVISGVTYDGESMTEVVTTPDSVVGSERFRIEGFFLGSGVNPGAVTVTATVSGGDSHNKHMTVCTVTAASDTQLAGTTGVCNDFADSGTNPSCDITGISGASYAFGTYGSGQANLGDVTAGTGFTMRHDHDWGARQGGTESSTSEQSSGNQTVAFGIAASDEYAIVGVAIEETGGGSRRLMVIQ